MQSCPTKPDVVIPVSSNTPLSLTAVYSSHSGAGEVLVWQGLSLSAVLSSDVWVQRCQKAFTLLSWFSVVSVEHLLVLLGEGSTLKKRVAVCFSERRGRVEKNLQALFIFQESRMVVKYCEYYSLSLHLFLWPSPCGSICMKLSVRIFYQETGVVDVVELFLWFPTECWCFLKIQSHPCFLWQLLL